MVFISEVRYWAAADNDWIEIVAPEGTDVSGYEVVNYNVGGTIEGQTTGGLGAPVATMNGYDIYIVTGPDLATGAGVYRDDSVALVDNGTVVQFLGLEGTATLATEGPANGLTSDPMPVTSGSGFNSIRSFDGLSYEEGAHDQGVFIPCFASGTLIATPQGPRLIEDIRAGDRLLVRGGSPEPVLWAGSYRVRFGPKTLNHLPVQIKRGAMGWGLPQRDLVVSPQHRILLGGAAAGTGPGPLMAKAKSLLPMPGVRRMCGKSSITYHTLLLPQHSVIYAEGLPTESFYPGPYAMRALPEQIRRQIEAALCGRADSGSLAAPELGRREGEMLARNGLASTVLPQGLEGCLSGLLPAKAASAQTDHAKSQP